MQYELWIQRWRPPLLNQFVGRHWQALHRAKVQTADLLHVLAIQQGVPGATGLRRLALTIRLWGRQKQCDADAPWKVLLDSLKRAGLLIDDGPLGLAGLPSLSFERVGKEKAGTLILLEDV